jgi:hypothetical protein
MSVTVEVIRKGEKASIDVLTIAKRIAAFAPGLIIDRVDAGLDIKDKPFAPYSPNYRAALALANEDGKVDLRLTGGLINSVKVRRIVRKSSGAVVVHIGPDSGTSPRVPLAPPWVVNDPTARAAWAKDPPQRRGKRGPPHNAVGAYLHKGTPTMKARPWLGLSPADLKDLRKLLGL